MFYLKNQLEGKKNNALTMWEPKYQKHGLDAWPWNCRRLFFSCLIYYDQDDTIIRASSLEKSVPSCSHEDSLPKF